jgi:hypothetical protein
MTENVALAAIVAAVLSLLLEWFPGLRVWWDGFDSSQKRGLMALAVMLTALMTTGVQCLYYDNCPADWMKVAVELFLAFIAAAAGSQGVHQLTKRPPVVIEGEASDVG